LNVTNSTISNNSAGSGGGIFNGSGTLNVTNSTISNNSTAGSGGGVGGGISNGGTLNVTNSTVSNNSAPGGDFGGGIFSSGGSIPNTLTITNSTISNNSADDGGQGGGIFNGNSTLNVTNSTISNNSASFGGGIYINTITVKARNTIIAGNTDALGSPDVQGHVVSQGNNLIGIGDGSTGVTDGVNGDQVGTSGSPINALLAPLGNYGGPTQTLALLPGSPAINAGNNTEVPAADQRGIARPVQTTVDIGAFESQGFTMAISGGNNQSAQINTAFATPLTLTVSSAFSEPVDGGIVTFTVPGAGASASLAASAPTVSGGSTSTGTVTANGTAGAYSVTAGASGVASGVSFSLTNVSSVTGSGTTAHIGPAPSNHMRHGGTGSVTFSLLNNGPGSTSGTITVTGTLPAGLTLGTVPTGSPWNCNAATSTAVTCTNGDPIAQGSSYSLLTIPVNVASNAPASATVSGFTFSGANMTAGTFASDTIPIDPAPILSILKSHTGTFTQGSLVAWTLQITNNSATASGATDGSTVTVTDAMPAGWTIQSTVSGPEWTCTSSTSTNLVCTATSVVAGNGGTFSAITMNVNVPGNAAISTSNTAKVFGGGDLNHTNSGNAATQHGYGDGDPDPGDGQSYGRQ